VWWRWASPDPGLGPGVEMLGRHARRQVDLLGIGEGLAGEGLPAEEAPPAFLQVEPTGPRGEGDGVDARMLPQPLLDRPAGMAGEVVADQVQLALGIGRVQPREEFQVADGVARRRGEGELVAVPHAQRPVDPHLLVAAPVVERRLDPVAGRGPAGSWGEGARDYRAQFVQ